MSKLIAIWGSPFSGKTTFAVKLASVIYERYKSRVIVLHADMQCPALPVLFPNNKAEDIFSVGEALSAAEITQESVIRSLVTVKGKPNLAFLGFKDGENRYTYAAFGTEKVHSLFNVLRSLADFIITDCTSGPDNLLTETALLEADQVIRLVTPDLKSMSYYTSQLPLYADAKYRMERHITGMVITENEVYPATEEIRHIFGIVSFTLPYSREIRRQTLEGTLTERLHELPYMKKINAIAERLVQTT